MTHAQWRELLTKVASTHFIRVEDPKDVCGIDGAQMWNGEWYMPLSGCDTLGNMLDDMVYAVERASS